MQLADVQAQLEGHDDPLAKFLWENTREGWAFVKPDGTMSLVNPAFADMLGWSVPELTGRRFQEITVERDVAPDESMFKRMLSGDVTTYSMVKTYRRKVGGTVTCRLRALNFDTGVLVCGTLLPIDTLSLEQLPDEDAKRVLAMLVGRWAIENWKVIAVALLALAGMLRMDDLLALFKVAP